MDLHKVKPSKNFEDHTGRGEVAKFLDFLFTNLNPLYAYDKIKHGDRRQGLDFRGTKPSPNFEDRTATPKSPEFINKMLFDLLRQTAPPGELLKTQDHRRMLVDPVLNIAHDPYKLRVTRGN